MAAPPAETNIRRVAGAPWHLAFATALPFLQVAAMNAHRLRLDNVVRSAAPVLAGVLLLWGLLRWLVRPARRADLIATTLVFSFLSYGYFATSPDFLYAWLGGTALAVAVLALVSPSWNVAAALNVFFLLLVLSPVVTLVSLPHWSTRARATRLALEHVRDFPEPPAGAAQEVRDVYYVILDRYARGDQLREVYGFDNEPFLTALEARGFFVARESYSNYQRTAHSLASSLNAAYLDFLSEVPWQGGYDWVPLFRLLEDARVPRFFRRRGYAFHFFGTWWEPTRRNALADRNHNWKAIPELLGTIQRNSLLGDAGLAPAGGLFDRRRHQYERIHRQFAALRALSTEPGPKLVVAHLLVPHPPFMLDRDGSFLDVAAVRSRGRRASYLAQVEFANSEILAWLDGLLARPGPRPVVIVQSDEGPWPARYAGEEIRTLGGDVQSVDWRTVAPSALREKMGILNALHFPDRPGLSLRPGLSPVNTFRIVLREYFGLELDDLPDRHFAFADDRHLYSFLPVDARLAAPDAAWVQAPPPTRPSPLRPGSRD